MDGAGTTRSGSSAVLNLKIPHGRSKMFGEGFKAKKEESI
jgi:hypothetical protein